MVRGNNELRSKTRVFNEEIRSLDQLPKWNYDGSSTEQAEGTDSEVF
jgi:glutamine synthetase